LARSVGIAEGVEDGLRVDAVEPPLGHPVLIAVGGDPIDDIVHLSAVVQRPTREVVCPHPPRQRSPVFRHDRRQREIVFDWAFGARREYLVVLDVPHPGAG